MKTIEQIKKQNDVHDAYYKKSKIIVQKVKKEKSNFFENHSYKFWSNQLKKNAKPGEWLGTIPNGRANVDTIFRGII